MDWQYVILLIFGILLVTALALLAIAVRSARKFGRWLLSPITNRTISRQQ